MGYVHDTECAVVIPIGQMEFVTGTWTKTVASNVWTNNKTATDETSTIRIPIPAPLQNANAYKGCRIKSVTIYYTIGTAAADAVSAALYKASMPVTGTIMSAAAVTTSYDTGHDTAAERLTADEHTMVLTVSTPEWMDDDAMYFVELSIDAAATSVVKVGDAIAKFDVRL